MVQSLWKTVQQFPAKLNVGSPHDPVIALLDIYPNESKKISTPKPAHKCL